MTDRGPWSNLPAVEPASAEVDVDERLVDHLIGNMLDEMNMYKPIARDQTTQIHGHWRGHRIALVISPRVAAAIEGSSE